MRVTGPRLAAPAAAAVARPEGFRLPPWLAMLTAVAGGLVLMLSFPPFGFWPLAVFGPALLVLALWRQRLRTAFISALVFGLFFFFPLLAWLVNVAWYVWTALAAAEAVVFAVLAVGQWLLLRMRAWPVLVAGWWVVAEAVRDRWPWEGFPWGRLVMSQATAPTIRWVAYLGPPFLTFLVALVGGCLAWVLLGAAQHGAATGPAGPSAGELRLGPRPGPRLRPRPGSRLRPRLAELARRLPGRAWAAIALVGSAGITMAGGLLPAGQVPAGSPTTVVAAIQGDVPHARNLPALLNDEEVTENHATATEALAARVRRGSAPAPNLVVWPENSTDNDPRFDPYIYDTLVSAVAAIRAPVLVGEVLQDPQRNVGQIWLPGKGPIGPIYVKRRLVPFGETIPWRSIIDKITSLPSLQPNNFTPGHKAVVMDLGKIRVGDVICYEVGFDGLVSSEVAKGANLLTVQSNDADFEIDGQTGETLQQLDMARVRAVEHDRSVVVASTTGISAIIAPDGSLLASTKTWTSAEIEARVPLISATTLADRVGGAPEAVLVGGTLAAMAWVVAQELRRRRAGGRHPAPAGGQAAAAGGQAAAAGATPLSSEEQGR